MIKAENLVRSYCIRTYFKFTKNNLIFSYLIIAATAFLIHAANADVYLEKSLSGRQNVADMGFLYRTQILYFNPMIFRLEHLSLVENTVQHIHFDTIDRKSVPSSNHV